MSSLRQRLKECVPPAYYSDGREAKCMWYKLFNMFDIDPQSYIIDKKNNGMKTGYENYSCGTTSLPDSISGCDSSGFWEVKFDWKEKKED